MIIQIIGAPGTGKTYAIKKYLNNVNNIKYLDIANYTSSHKGRYAKLKHDIIKYKGNVIVESACGINIKNSVIIKYKKNNKTVYKNLIKRDGEFDMDYISLLLENSLKPNYTVKEMKALHKLLDYFLNTTKK